jgi:hypothetical protein
MRETQLLKVNAWLSYERYAESMVTVSPAASHASRMAARSSTMTARTRFVAEPCMSPAADATTRSSGAESAVRA